jgi:serine/threonine protein kinase
MWYAMRAFTGRLDLDAVHSRMMRPVHRGFAFHIFLQVGEALQFLHETCGVAHQDLHMGNIMVDTARQDIEGLPNLVIVDLEFSVLRQEGGNEKRLTQLMQRDRECFCQIVYRFLVRKRSCNMCVHWKPHDGCPDAANWPAQFNVFRQCMRGWSRRDPAPAWKDLLGRFTDLAVMGRFQMSEQDLKDLKELIWGLVEADEKRLERDIRKALPFLGPKVSEV